MHLGALLAYPAFYTGRPVVTQGTIVASEREVWLEGRSGERIRIVGNRAGTEPAIPSPLRSAASAHVEVRGVMIDVGSYRPDDPRLAGTGMQSYLDHIRFRGWPRPGEMLLLGAQSRSAYVPGAANPERLGDLTIDPERYAGQGVSVIGQFRGRNLLTDLPARPNRGLSEFVLARGGAAVWIVGLPPKGPEFNLDPAEPRDVGRWLRVTGTVRHQKGLVWIEGAAVERASEPSGPDRDGVAPAPPPPPLAPPEVAFSLPVEGETDVAVRTTVRVQFSRVMDASAFLGKVRVGYVGDAQPRTELPSATPEFKTEYIAGDRVLAIRFAAPLERFRTVRVELLEGITAPDGTPLKPWTLTFSTGG